jgi:apolipoprotein N-acyltransferase
MILLQEVESGFIERARALAREIYAHLLLGLYSIPDGYPNVGTRNQAVWIAPDGAVKWRYLKARPVPGAELVIAGDGVIPVDRSGPGAIASVICFDMDHPAFIRQAGRAGVDVMLDPSDDYPGIVPFHTYIASLGLRQTRYQ